MGNPAAPPPMIWGPEYGQNGSSGPVYAANAGAGADAGGVYGMYGVGRQVSGTFAVGNETFNRSEIGLDYPREPSGLRREYEIEGREDEEEEEESEDELQAGDMYGQRVGVRRARR